MRVCLPGLLAVCSSLIPLLECSKINAPESVTIETKSDTIIVDDSLLYYYSHNTLILEHSPIDDISFLKEYPDIQRLDISNTPVKDLSPLLDITDLKLLAISECTSISDFSILTQILGNTDRLYCMGTPVPQEVLSELESMGVLLNPPRNYIFIGHPRLYDSLDQKVYPEIERTDYNQFDMVLLGGDMLRNTTTTPGGMDYLNAVFDLDNPHTLFSPGNHDYEEPLAISDYTHRPLFFAYTTKGITFLNLDTQDAYSKGLLNDITGDQLELFKAVTDTIADSDWLVLLTHKLLWMYDGSVLEDTLGSIVNTGSCNRLPCTNPNNFYADIYPRLLVVKNRGVKVLCLAGDLGYQVYEFEYTTGEGIHFIASGLGPGMQETGERENRVLFLEHDQSDGSLSWRYVPTSELPVKVY